MKQFIDLLKDIYHNGRHLDPNQLDRTGIGTKKLFRRTIRHQMKDGFPRLTTKFVSFKIAFWEWKWIVTGQTNTGLLKENGIDIWDEWALKPEHCYRVENIDWGVCFMEGIDTKDIEDEPDFEKVKQFITSNSGKPIEHFFMYQVGDLGRVYGHQLVKERNHNQLLTAFNDLKERPESRRILLSNWNPWDLPDENKSPEENVLNGSKPALASCHAFFQFDSHVLYPEERRQIYRERFNLSEGIEIADNILDLCHIPKRQLNLSFYMRSSDVVLGLPYNLEYYGIMLLSFAHCLNMYPGELIYDGGNCHIYNNQMTEELTEWMNREPLQLQKITIDTKGRHVEYPWELEYDDFVQVTPYEHQGRLSFEIAK